MYQLDFSFSPEKYDYITGKLFDLEVHSFQEHITDINELPDHEIVCSKISVYSDSLKMLQQIHKVLEPSISEVSITEITDDYKDEWKKFAQAIRISDKSIIVPSWIAEKGEDAEHIIRLDPGYAFGSGSHATTLLCLRALEASNLSDSDTLLDVGSGSGVLSIFASKIFGLKSIGIDIDPEAASSASENAKRNGVSSLCTFSEDSLNDITDSFDVVVANILSPVIMAFGENLTSKVKDGGILILSGILEEELIQVQEALSLEGSTTKTLDEWGLISWKK